MARSVYADPFGSYIQGYDTGAQREMALQRGTRDARAMDWDMYNMKPIELETAQRNNAYQQFADPFQRQMLPIGLRNAQNAGFLSNIQAAEPLSWLGINQPFMNAIKDYTGYGYSGTPDGAQFVDPATGMPQGPVVNMDTIAPWYWRKEHEQMRQFNLGHGINMTELEMRARQQQLQAEQERRLWMQGGSNNPYGGAQPFSLQNLSQEWFGGWSPQQQQPQQAAPDLEQYKVTP